MRPIVWMFRWDQGATEWIEYSEVDPVNNRITAIHVTAFGVWGIGTVEARPTSARVQSVTAHPSVAYAGLILLGVLAIATLYLLFKYGSAMWESHLR